MGDNKSPIRISSYGAGGVSISGISEDDQNNIRAAIDHGNVWIRVNPETGVLESTSAFEPLPEPYEDAQMWPHWGPPFLEKTEMHLLPKTVTLDERPEAFSACSPCLYISNLCLDGKYEFYKDRAKIMESYGFSCLRSRRGMSGNFTEVWLSSLLGAKGEFRNAIHGIEGNDKQIEAATKFFQHIGFAPATLDVSMMRMYWRIDD
ncbi:MAG: hypothetical protein KBC98_02875 [Candidatus Pacebacteria bacterium]|nr:hypothetical protein [Candidatus Paceibacterota bacterium]